ncbi:General stress protein CsbD [Balamuthia mandrillaris]
MDTNKDINKQEPSVLSGMAQKAKGVVKENLGWAMGNEKLEAEGKLERREGDKEWSQAQMQHQAKGYGEKIEGSTKETAGKALGDQNLEMRGKAENLKGEVRKEATK